jgi:hypothetical protein
MNFEPGSVCYYGSDSVSVIIIRHNNKSTNVCPLAGGSTFEVDPAELRFNDGSIPSGTEASKPDSTIGWVESRKRKKKNEDE